MGVELSRPSTAEFGLKRQLQLRKPCRSLRLGGGVLVRAAIFLTCRGLKFESVWLHFGSGGLFPKTPPTRLARLASSLLFPAVALFLRSRYSRSRSARREEGGERDANDASRSFVEGGGGGGSGGGGVGGGAIVDLFPRSLGSALSGAPEVREGRGGEGHRDCECLGRFPSTLRACGENSRRLNEVPLFCVWARTSRVVLH